MFRSKSPIIFFGLFILIASIFTLYLLVIELEDNTSFHANSLKGVANLTNVDFNKNKLVGLTGEYEFYWKQLLTPTNFLDSTKKQLTGYLELPGLWNGFVLDGEKLKGDGYATFRLIIQVPDEDYYAIKVKEFDCAYKMWVNGVYLERGIVGTDELGENPNWKRNEIIFFSKDRVVELVFQVSNFVHRKGGPEDLMLFGKSNSILSYKHKQIAFSYFLLGILVIMFIYHYGLYIVREKEISNLIFSLVCFFIIIRLISTGEKIIYNIYPSISWGFLIRVEYISYTVIPPLMYAFMRCLFPDEFYKLYERIISFLCVVVVLIVVFLPVKIFSYTPLFYQNVVGLTAVITLIGLIKSVLNKRENSYLMLSGYLIFFIAVINDILYYNNLLHSAFLLPFGLFSIVLVNGFTLSRRFSNSFLTIEALTTELGKNNLELENKVEERTKVVLEQKQEIEKQAIILKETNKKLTEQDEFKENMTQMIVHDLKNPLNTIINLSMLEDFDDKNKIIYEAGKGMLNLVSNILDVYKYEKTSMNLSIEPIKLNDLIDSALKDVLFLGKIRDTEINCQKNNDIAIFVDYTIMHRTLVNLFTNAIKFSPLSGKVKIFTSIDNHELINISIWNNGPIINPERQKIIFDRYHSETIKDSVMLSTGLGLHFCKIAIESHGGNISLESNSNDGTTFTITFPIKNISNNDSKHSISENGEGDLNIKKSISTEDIEEILPYIEDLKRYEVYQVSDIFNALEKIKSINVKFQRWINLVAESVMQCNQSKYSKLINSFLDE
ncbi:MAG: sensor histidine kinase [Bacteroidales bacterium]|nr:sensor histidine kinase [Bacteroidales bacterium]